MKFKIILKIILKNFLALLCGAVLGILILFIFLGPILSAAMPKDVGLGVIALAPVLMIMYGIIFTVAGGAAALITYNLFVFFKKRRQK